MTDETTPAAEQEPGKVPEVKHTLKEELRGAVAKAVGVAVEAGSMLSGNSGEIVTAEGAVAEADTEKLLDRVDGEG